MKATNGILVIALALSCSSLAQTPEPQASNDAQTKTLTWLNAIVPPGIRTITFGGRTKKGRSCALYITNTGDNQNYFVVVGFRGENNPRNSYIGVVFPLSEVIHLHTRMFFKSDESWGNDSRWNRVHVFLNSDGKPRLATGYSDLTAMACENLVEEAPPEPAP